MRRTEIKLSLDARWTLSTRANFHSNRFHGQGKYVWAVEGHQDSAGNCLRFDGTFCSEGEWVAGELHGQGTSVFETSTCEPGGRLYA